MGFAYPETDKTLKKIVLKRRLKTISVLGLLNSYIPTMFQLNFQKIRYLNSKYPKKSYSGHEGEFLPGFDAVG